MLEVTKPSNQHGIQIFDYLLKTVPTSTSGLVANAAPQGFHAFLTDPSFPGFESITQKIEALSRYHTIPDMGLVRMKRQTVFGDPTPYFVKCRLGKLWAGAHHDKQATRSQLFTAFYTK